MCVTRFFLRVCVARFFLRVRDSLASVSRVCFARCARFFLRVCDSLACFLRAYNSLAALASFSACVDRSLRSLFLGACVSLLSACLSSECASLPSVCVSLLACVSLLSACVSSQRMRVSARVRVSPQRMRVSLSAHVTCAPWHICTRASLPAYVCLAHMHTERMRLFRARREPRDISQRTFSLATSLSAPRFA